MSKLKQSGLIFGAGLLLGSILGLWLAMKVAVNLCDHESRQLMTVESDYCWDCRRTVPAEKRNTNPAATDKWLTELEEEEVK
jgi:hypothetical protein